MTTDQIEKQRADASRRIRLERRTRPMGEVNMHHALVADPACPGAITMDLTPFFDGPEHLDDVVRRVLEHGGSPVRIGEAGPGSLHTGHEAGLTYDVLTRSQVAEAVPEVVFLHDNAATACLRQATKCDDLVPLPGERGLNINITDGGHVHEWHVGGPDLLYTSSTGLQVPAPGAGIPLDEVVYVDEQGRQIDWDGDPEDLRDRFGNLLVTPDTPGAFVWHDGARKHATLIPRGHTLVAPGYTPHGVNAVPPGFVRITLIMSWVHQADVAAAELGSGRYGREGEGGELELADYLYGEDGHTGELKAK